jgi:phage baseplate assembly protein gpV
MTRFSAPTGRSRAAKHEGSSRRSRARADGVSARIVRDVTAIIDRQEYFGLYPALVADVDPTGQARVEVSFPWLGTPDVRAWATLLTSFASAVQSSDVPPKVGTQVVVGFEAGDLRRPYVVGTPLGGSAPTRVTLSSREGHAVTLDDGDATVEVRHANGSIVTLTADGRIVVHAVVTVDVTAPTVHVRTPIAQFAGVVSCATLIADQAVVSPVFTPGP